MTPSSSPSLALMAWAHGLFYVATGVWPLVHMRSFLAVTGPKVDLWLVRTVGALIAVIGASLLAAGAAGEVPRHTVGLAVGAAASLAIVDLRYVSCGRIPKIYLLDALAEGLLIAAWVAALSV